ncbi:MAG TPA: Hsp20/alpha crystallin family protein [Tepidisphaeraceae bacterium]|jgi:HSP20 family protein|nr:Hsp20/alpha crystallin family protein [Tepidisphaeraceae bacterium]
MSTDEIDTATEQPFQNVQRQMNKIVEQMQKGYYNYRPGETWTPSVNLYETETEYLVCVDLGGVDKEKIDIELIDQRLTIKGNRTVPTPPTMEDKESDSSDSKKYRVHLMEIDHGLFGRDVELPLDVVKEQIHATHRNGMLWIELPKK